VNPRKPTTGNEQLRQELERMMLDHYGPVLGVHLLYRVLGYPTAAAFRQGVLRGKVAVPIFEIPGRRGRFALTQDVVTWLAERRISAVDSTAAPSRLARQKDKCGALTR